jgi:superfamily II helicase
MKAFEEFKKTDPQLAEEFASMDRETLLNQICLEVKDAQAMEERVSLFMEILTSDMSKTNYTPDTIRELVSQKYEKDISEFYHDIVDECDSVKDIARTIKERAQEFDKVQL